MKKIESLYFKYTVKKPILFFAVIAFNVILIMIIAFLTKTSEVITCEAIIEGNHVIVFDNVESHTGYIYVYSDRNEHVYCIEVAQKKAENGGTVFYPITQEDFALLDKNNIHADVPIEEISLFERIFMRGGKNNG